MVRYRVLWEAHVRRFQDAHEQYKKRRLTAEEAGDLLGLSGRCSPTIWMRSSVNQDEN